MDLRFSKRKPNISGTERIQRSTRRQSNSRVKRLLQRSDVSALDHFVFPRSHRPNCIELLAREPICFLLCLYSSFLLSVLYLFFEAFPLVFKNNHGFELQYIGLTFIGLGVGEVGGMLISRPIVSALTDWLLRGKNREEELHKPEFRLIPAMIGAILVPIGMFWFAFTGYSSVPWIVPILAGIPFGWGVVLGTLPRIYMD